MELKDIVKAVDAASIVIGDENLLENQYVFVFASDLMSDALAMINDHYDSTIILTGLCNQQALRTAEMLDIKNIIFVRGKLPDEETKDLALKMHINLFSTNYLMYETCGLLYKEGLKSSS